MAEFSSLDDALDVLPEREVWTNDDDGRPWIRSGILGESDAPEDPSISRAIVDWWRRAH